jgi:uncharacterized membrane protein
VNRYLAIGLATFAGAALLEVALVPAAAVAGAIVLAPAVVPTLRRQLQAAAETLTEVVTRPFTKPAAAPPAVEAADDPSQSLLARLGVGQAIAKTVTFRIIVTSLDFTTNYVVLGELTTAAGLSTFNLVAGPIFYFAHETVWNHVRPSPEAVAVLGLKTAQGDDEVEPQAQDGWHISRALAKTITYRAIATVMDFTTNFVVVGDVVTAVALTASGFVLGPFVYWGHEKAWDRFSGSTERELDPPPSAPSVGPKQSAMA